MKFEILATSYDVGQYFKILERYGLETGKAYVNIEHLDELISLQKEIEQEIIISDGVIEIYDGYRE